MQRAKPYRQHPTGYFMQLYDIALNLRMYLVQENGPTKLVLEDLHHKKFKVQIGNTISCSCGGGREEHCVHTIYALIKIFRMEEGDELIWQLAFTDQEISQIIQNRHRNRSTAWNRQEYGIYQQVYSSNFNRQQSHSQQPPNNRRAPNYQSQQQPSNTGEDEFEAIYSLPPPKKAKEIKRATVNRMTLEKNEPCCVCHENMKPEDNLTFCKYGCGRNIHIDCIEVWVKHKMVNKQPITCPLCRTDWGQNVLEELKEETKQNQENARLLKEQDKQKKFVTDSIMNKAFANAPQNDRAFNCYSCKRKIMYEAKYQCLLCEICKICFDFYHDRHDFIVRPSPDKDWEPAFRPQPQIADQNEIQNLQKLQSELKNREAKLDDYNRLLDIQTRQSIIKLPKYLRLVFEKYFPPTQEYMKMALIYCSFCEMKIDDKTKGLIFKNCEHLINHKETNYLQI